MSDLPQRLRLNATIPLVMEAADRIEALEVALTDISELVDGYEDADDGQPNLAMRVATIARAALTGGGA